MCSAKTARLGALLVAALIAVAAEAYGQPLTVAAASDLQSALPAITAVFEKESGQKVTVTFGSSGNFFTQISNGAPFDVFLSADLEYPQRLEAAGLAERGSVVEYARGRLVIWTRRDSGIDVARGLPVLGEPKVRRIAIANPDHAPYGRAAIAALRADGLYERVKTKFIVGENISQTAQFAQSGGADVGLIALSLALSPALKDAGVTADVPVEKYPPIRQAAAVVAASKQKTAARQFIDALRAPAIAKILASYGFDLPPR